MAPAAPQPSPSSPEPTLVAAASLVELGPEEKQLPTATTLGEEEGEPYTIYTNRERWMLVSVVAVAGLFS